MNKPINFKLILVMLFCGICIGVASGCKKDKPKIDNKIVGLWMDTPSRILNFKSNGEFSLQINIDNYTTLYGTYSIQGDSLKVKIKSHEVRVAPNPGVKTNVPEYTLYEKGTFEVNDETLTLKYISYPFDAPIETSVTFTRTYRID